jgi:hypothetical protein
MKNRPKNNKRNPKKIAPIPVGSPYGFTQEDMDIVAERIMKDDELRVVLGVQFQSMHYNTEMLKNNLEAKFQKAVNEYNKKANIYKVTLTFQSLSAGYGEHLFNEIVRDIISADIAVFEASDLNPNVMIEIGVALTWGVLVFPIKEERCSKLPSDISGQTWSEYRHNAAEFLDPNQSNKLLEMIDRAARKKGRLNKLYDS